MSKTRSVDEEPSDPVSEQHRGSRMNRGEPRKRVPQPPFETLSTGIMHGSDNRA